MKVFELLEKVRAERPLIHHITNWVTIYDCANATRAFGALPVMAHAKEESGDMANIASALVLNIGTLTPELVESMLIAGRSANKKGIPVILDAVGAGATKLRDDAASEIIFKTKLAVIKGNASEIARITGIDVKTRGVESTKVDADLAAIAAKLAKETDSVVVVTGKEDIASDGKRTFIVRNGDPMMSSIVGTGCMAASVIAAFCAVEKDHARASAAALSAFGIAAELAAKKSSGPGSFKANLYDEIHNLDENIDSLSKVDEK